MAFLARGSVTAIGSTPVLAWSSLSAVLRHSLRGRADACGDRRFTGEEAAAFDEMALQTSDVKEVAQKLAAIPKANADRPRLVVLTRGGYPTIIVHGARTYARN